MKVRDLKEKLNQFDEDDEVVVYGAKNKWDQLSVFDVLDTKNTMIRNTRMVALELKEW